MWTTQQMATPPQMWRRQRGLIETGMIPVMVFEESWMKDYGND